MDFKLSSERMSNSCFILNMCELMSGVTSRNKIQPLFLDPGHSPSSDLLLLLLQPSTVCLPPPTPHPPTPPNQQSDSPRPQSFIILR